MHTDTEVCLQATLWLICSCVSVKGLFRCLYEAYEDGGFGGLPFVVLACAGAVRDGDGPVEVLSVKTCSVRSSPLKRHLSAQQTLVTVLVGRRPALVVGVGTRHA